MMNAQNKKYLRLLTYISGFFLTVHMAFPSYFNSQFLGQFLSARGLGLVYIIASLITIVGIIYTPKLIRSLGLIRALGWLIAIDAVAIFPLPFISSPAWIISFFVVYYAIGLIIRYALDIYLEKISDDRIEGGIRGVFLTFMNLAWLASPFIASQLIASRGYSIVFLVAALQLLPLIYIVLFSLEEAEHHRRVKQPSMRQALSRLWKAKTAKDRDLRNVLATDFLLNFFYAIMVIYMALYLATEIKLSEVGIGTAFTVMLLPFVLFELPLGKIADRWLGEKEILASGFILMSVSTAAISFLDSPAVWLWALLLFLTRTGAASVEIMKETYLFKKVGGNDVNIVAISRNMQPITYIIGPLLVSAALPFVAFKFIWLALAVISFTGVFFALALRDTK